MIKKHIVIAGFICIVGFATGAQEQSNTFRISKSLSIFNSVLREIDLFYVDTINYEAMVKTAIDHMLRELDPYTVYIPENEASDLTFLTTGEYAGIGAMITRTGDGICISELYEGMPAQKNGLRAGDIILEIDGVKTDNMTVSDASGRLKGTPNTMITLKIKRYGEQKHLTKKFPREKILIHPISYASEIATGTGYILLNDFTEQASLEFKNAVKDLIAKHQIKSLIIDVRNNGGGLIDEAVKIMGYFVPKGTEIVSIRGKSIYASHTYKTTVEPIFPDLKLAVMVNSNSASASEILAGAVQDLDRGIVVGERTFGKGLVQNIRPVSYGGHVKVTTAKYYIPSGRCIQAIDYAKRNDDGSIRSIPDSVIKVFKTRNGRPVKDGGGIIPDTITSDDRNINIAYYIYSQNLYFDFATQYAARHSSIASPTQFRLTDDEMLAFRNFLKEKKFSYTPQTKKYFDELYQFSKFEGLDSEAEAEFEALRKKLLPDMDTKLKENDSEIRELLSLEIIKRYYFQRGQIEFSHQTDKELKTTINILQQEQQYNNLLTRGL